MSKVHTFHLPKSIAFDEETTNELRHEFDSLAFAFKAQTDDFGAWICLRGYTGVYGENRTGFSKYWDNNADYIDNMMKALDFPDAISFVIDVLAAYIEGTETIATAA